MKPTAVPQDGTNAGRALGGRGLAMPPACGAVPVPAGWERRESPAGPRRGRRAARSRHRLGAALRANPRVNRGAYHCALSMAQYTPAAQHFAFWSAD